MVPRNKTADNRQRCVSTRSEVTHGIESDFKENGCRKGSHAGCRDDVSRRSDSLRRGKNTEYGDDESVDSIHHSRNGEPAIVWCRSMEGE
jgi:hypothetical protein